MVRNCPCSFLHLLLKKTQDKRLDGVQSKSEDDVKQFLIQYFHQYIQLGEDNMEKKSVCALLSRNTFVCKLRAFARLLLYQSSPDTYCGRKAIRFIFTSVRTSKKQKEKASVISQYITAAKPQVSSMQSDMGPFTNFW